MRPIVDYMNIMNVCATALLPLASREPTIVSIPVHCDPGISHEVADFGESLAMHMRARSQSSASTQVWRWGDSGPAPLDPI
jgi:hypothetical protein